MGLHRVKCSLLAQVSPSDSPNVWKLWPSTWFRKQTTSPTANSGWRAGCWATMTPEFRLFLLKFLPETPRAIKRDSTFRVWTWTCFWSVALSLWRRAYLWWLLESFRLLHDAASAAPASVLKNRCNAVMIPHDSGKLIITHICARQEWKNEKSHLGLAFIPLMFM